MAQYQGPIVDVDVHHRWKTEDEVLGRLPQQWQDYVGRVASAKPAVVRNHRASIMRPPMPVVGSMLANAARRADTYPADGSAPGSDYRTLSEQLLDRYGYFRVLLTHDVGEYGAHPNQYFAAALCRAVNDWNLETWLSIPDDRLRSFVVIPSGSPLEAAAEIRRVGGHPKIVGVLLAGNMLGRPFGDPAYHPIYEACHEMGLMVSIHSAVAWPSGATTSVGGPPSTNIQQGSQFGQQGMHFVSSFIVHGVFERYPQLKVIITEFGIGWIPSFVWRLDSQQRYLQRESPWVKRLPSEYIRDHIRFSTQPVEEGNHPKSLSRYLSSLAGIEDLLCFSSDYPHITADDPRYVDRILPDSWASKVFCENACKIYGWHIPEAWQPQRNDKVGMVS